MNRSIFTILLVLSPFFLASCGNEETLPPKVKETSPHPTPAISAPTVPIGISTLSADGQVTIRWNAIEDATSYNVYFSDFPNAVPSNWTKAGATAETSFIHTNLKNATLYYYIVTAVNASGESGPSGETGAMPKGTPPATPTGVAASGGDGKITVRWNEVQGAKSYNLYYATEPRAAQIKGKKIVDIKMPFWQHIEAKKNTMYYYVVTALNSDGESPGSNESGAMP